MREEKFIRRRHFDCKQINHQIYCFVQKIFKSTLQEEYSKKYENTFYLENLDCKQRKKDCLLVIRCINVKNI